MMDPLSTLIQNLLSDGRLRVWSLVMTVFGDSVQHRGGQITSARLGRLLGRIGVETGALRTALSRLARDGWVVGERQGRTSAYRLTPQGEARFSPASARIYAAPRIAPVSIWTFCDSGPGLPVAGGFVRPAGGAANPGFSINGTLGPAARNAIADALPDAHVHAMRRMAQDITTVAKLGRIDPLTAIAARTLLIHRWRRLVLRWPEVPADVMPSDITPPDLHRAMADAYMRVAPRAERWLDEADADLAAMPAAAVGFAQRFGGG